MPLFIVVVAIIHFWDRRRLLMRIFAPPPPPVIRADEFEHLSYVLRSYYHQSWEFAHCGDELAPIGSLVALEDRAALAAIRSDMARFLARGYAVEDVGTFLDGLELGPMRAEDFAELLTSAIATIDAALAKRAA